MGRKLLIAVVAVTIVLVAAVIVVRAWVMRDDTAPVSVDKVLRDYRGEAGGATTPAGTAIPTPGVYTYRTTGGEQVRLLGTSRHTYPAETSIAIRATDCGYRRTWSALDKRIEQWTFCAAPDALRPQTLRDVHSFYGQDDDRTYRCRGTLPLRTGGAPQTVVCRIAGATRTDTVEAVGREPIAVGGTSVDAVHLRIRTTMTGSTTTARPSETDWWLEPRTGLPIRIRVDVANTSDTPIDKKARYSERYELTLQSLTPRS